jgi:hypothetical protein
MILHVYYTYSHNTYRSASYSYVAKIVLGVGRMKGDYMGTSFILDI